MDAPEFNPGFRISWRDIVVIVLGIIASIALWPNYTEISFVIGVSVGHFFLFCNVFRISRDLELLWAAVFCVLFTATSMTGHPSINWVAVICIVWAAISILIETRKRSYHGIGWETINSGLHEWWKMEARRAEIPDEMHEAAPNKITYKMRMEKNGNSSRDNILIAEFEGVLGEGSAGNSQVDCIQTLLFDVISEVQPATVIVDLSRVRYTFGNHALGLVSKLRHQTLPTVLIISELCEQLGTWAQLPTATNLRVARSVPEALEMFAHT